MRARTDHRNAVLSLLGLMAIAGTAAAGPCGYTYRSSIADLDQKRAASASTVGLPNDGRMYCAPTSCIDNLAYMANHGYPNAVSTALPGPQSWTSSANYNFMGQCIYTMGLYLGTSATGGTNNYTSGLLNYMAANLPNDYIQIFADSFTPSGDLSGNVAEDMAGMIACGALVNLHIGWFERRGPSGARYWERTGGHVVALAGVDDACSSSPKLIWRDPSNGSSFYTQASSANSSSRLTLVADVFSWKDDPDKYFKIGWQFNAYTGDTKGFLGGYKAIWPNFGVGLALGLDTETLTFFMPKSTNRDGAPETRSAGISTINGPVKFLDNHPSNVFACVVTNPSIVGVSDKLLRVNYADGSVTQIAIFSGSGGPIVFGNTGELYACDGSVLKAINPRDGSVRLSAPLARTLDSLVFDDAGQVIIGLDRATKRIDSYNPSTLTLMSSRLLPDTVTLGSDASLALNPATGKAWLCPDQGGAFYEMTFPATTGGISLDLNALPGITNPLSFQITSKGDVVVNDNGILEELHQEGRFWIVGNRTGLSGHQFAREFRMPRTRETYNPLTIDLYETHDLLPVEVPDCRADLNDDGLVDFADYLEFLNFYDAEDPAADFNDDGLVDFVDYLEFLNQYDAGC
ncbi:MAG: hypothetical protein IT436_01315 [Phycisphaerales bacterium]|nr:hypothetical protein [Phycisphaerales bacterium]